MLFRFSTFILFAVFIWLSCLSLISCLSLVLALLKSSFYISVFVCCPWAFSSPLFRFLKVVSLPAFFPFAGCFLLICSLASLLSIFRFSFYVFVVVHCPYVFFFPLLFLKLLACFILFLRLFLFHLLFLRISSCLSLVPLVFRFSIYVCVSSLSLFFKLFPLFP